MPTTTVIGHKYGGRGLHGKRGMMGESSHPLCWCGEYHSGKGK